MRLFTTLLAALACLTASGQSSALSLCRAIELALATDHKIASYNHELQAAAYNRKAALALYMPRVEVSSAWVVTERDIGVDFNPLKPLLTPLGIEPLLSLDWRYTIQPRSFGFIEADIVQPLFAGGKIVAANRAAQIRKQATAATFTALRNTTLTTLVERYFGYILALNAVKVRELVVNAMQSHRSQVEALIGNGMATNTELLYVEYRLSEAKQQAEAARLMLRTAHRALAVAVGVESIDSTSTPLFVTQRLESLDHFTASAAQSNPQLHYAEQQRLLAQQNIALKRADFFPTVTLLAGGALTRNVTNLLPRWAVGIGVNFTLFNGLEREYSYLAAQSTYSRAEEALSAAKSDIALLVESLYNSTVAALQHALSLNASIAYATEYLANKEAAFAESLATSTDVLDAMTALAASQIEQLTAAYTFDITLARLLEAAGESEEYLDYAESINSQKIEYETH